MDKIRNHWLDLLKLFFIIVISFWHTGWLTMTHGYLPVEFFFIVSGYFIYKTYEKKKLSICDFFKSKCKRLLPLYWFVLICYIAISTLAPQLYKPADLLSKFLGIITDSLLLQATGITTLLSDNIFRYNNPDWYLSSFFWGGMIVYSMLKYKKIRLFIFACIIITTYGIYYTYLGNTFNEYWNYFGVIYMPLWRGVAGMSIGALLGILLGKQDFNLFIQRNKLIFNFATIISLILCISSLYNKSNWDIFILIPYTIITANAVSPHGINQYKRINCILKWVPDISLEILLIHYFLIIINVKICDTLGILSVDYLKHTLYIAILITSAIFLKNKIEPKIRENLSNICSKTRSFS